jgi:hypothetical protein
MIITKELAIKAYLHGACRLPKIGGRVSDLSTSDLVWCEEKKFVTPLDKKRMGVTLPVWVLSGYGYGYGSGYGDGYGDGSGYGSGYGSGDGFKKIEELLCEK